MNLKRGGQGSHGSGFLRPRKNPWVFLVVATKTGGAVWEVDKFRYPGGGGFFQGPNRRGRGNENLQSCPGKGRVG